MVSCNEKYTEVNGVNLCWFEWGAEHRVNGTILLVHATGFHARCWDRTVANLDQKHVIAVDMRGHGRSGKVPPYRWDAFGTDLAAWVETLDLDRVIGVGHSMGGHSVTQAAAAHLSRFEALVLVDPVILQPEAYSNFAGWGSADAHPVARRRNQFVSPDEMFEAIRTRGSYGQWEPDVLRDYCEYGLLPAPSGGFELACPPIVEATIYTGSASTDIYPLVDRVTVPVTVMRAQQREPNKAEMDFSKSPTWPELASRFPHGEDMYLPELTHFIPMQAPKLVADTILKYAP